MKLQNKNKINQTQTKITAKFNVSKSILKQSVSESNRAPILPKTREKKHQISPSIPQNSMTKSITLGRNTIGFINAKTSLTTQKSNKKPLTPLSNGTKADLKILELEENLKETTYLLGLKTKEIETIKLKTEHEKQLLQKEIEALQMASFRIQDKQFFIHTIQSLFSILVDVIDNLVKTNNCRQMNNYSNHLTNSYYSLDNFESFINAEEKRIFYLDQIQSILMTKVQAIKRNLNIDLTKDKDLFMKIKNLSQSKDNISKVDLSNLRTSMFRNNDSFTSVKCKSNILEQDSSFSNSNVLSLNLHSPNFMKKSTLRKAHSSFGDTSLNALSSNNFFNNSFKQDSSISQFSKEYEKINGKNNLYEKEENVFYSIKKDLQLHKIKDNIPNEDNILIKNSSRNDFSKELREFANFADTDNIPFVDNKDLSFQNISFDEQKNKRTSSLSMKDIKLNRRVDSGEDYSNEPIFNFKSEKRRPLTMSNLKNKPFICFSHYKKDN